MYKLLPAAIFGQLIFLGLVVMTSSVLRLVLFGLFWIASLFVLQVILSRKRWFATEWMVFASLSVAIVTAVLLSSKALLDTVAVIVPVLGLLAITGCLTSLPQKRASRKAPVLPKHIFYSTESSTKFHVNSCRMLKNKSDLQGFINEDEARAAGKVPCGICLKK